MNEPEIEAREAVGGYVAVAIGLFVVGFVVAAGVGLTIMPELPYDRVRGWPALYLLVSSLTLSVVAGFSITSIGVGIIMIVIGLSPWRWLERRPPIEVLPADVQITVREETP